MFSKRPTGDPAPYNCTVKEVVSHYPIEASYQSSIAPQHVCSDRTLIFIMFHNNVPNVPQEVPKRPFASNCFIYNVPNVPNVP